MKKSILLIHPPLVKPCEPPPGIAKLRGVLNKHNFKNILLYLNEECLFDLLKEKPSCNDTWTKMAYKNLYSHMSALRNFETYRNFDRYKRAVLDLNRLIKKAGELFNLDLTLSDYKDRDLSPLKSRDLLRSAEEFDKNIFYSYFSKRLFGIIENENPEYIGISLNYLSQALCAFSIAGFLKKNYPHIKIIMGGGLITSWMRRPNWKNPFEGLLDYMIDGPGEYELLKILGMDFKEEDSLPDYSTFPPDKYLSPGLILPYSASSGCYWYKCEFCPERAEGNPYVPLSVGKVISDIEKLSEVLNPVLIHFLDNAMSPKLLRSLAENPLKIPWYGFARFTEDLTDQNFCNNLKQSGCIMLKLGLESGSQEVLFNMKKGIELDLVIRVLNTLKNAGIGTYIYLLFGTPSENLLKARKTMEFIAHNSDKIDFLNLAIFNLPVYSKEAEEVKTREFYEGDLSLYTDFTHPEGWGRREIRRFLEKEFKIDPKISPIVQKNPPLFTSNHAPFFYENRSK